MGSEFSNANMTAPGLEDFFYQKVLQKQLNIVNLCKFIISKRRQVIMALALIIMKAEFIKRRVSDIQE